MKKIRVAFFDTKPYDRKSFDAANEKFGFELTYFEARLNPASARMAAGYDVVCAFVNDDIGAKTIKVLAEEKVQMIAMRCAGYNNVDLAAAYGKLVVVRVPGYSPYAVAEYALAMYMTLNRSLHRAYNRVRENNFRSTGSSAPTCAAKPSASSGPARSAWSSRKSCRGTASGFSLTTCIRTRPWRRSFTSNTFRSTCCTANPT